MRVIWYEKNGERFIYGLVRYIEDETDALDRARRYFPNRDFKISSMEDFRNDGEEPKEKRG